MHLNLKPVFKRSLIELNSEFIFSYTSHHTRTNQQQSALLFIHSRRNLSWIHTFPNDVSAVGNSNSLFQVLNLGTRFISYDDNEYTARALSLFLSLSLLVTLPMYIYRLGKIFFYCLSRSIISREDTHFKLTMGEVRISHNYTL